MITAVRNTISALILFLVSLYFTIAIPFLYLDQFKIWLGFVFHGEGVQVRIFHVFLIIVTFLFGGMIWLGFTALAINAWQWFLNLLLDWDDDRRSVMIEFNRFFDSLTFWDNEETLDGR